MIKFSKNDGGKNIYTKTYWNERNQSIILEEKARNFLKKVMREMQNEIDNS